MGAMIVHEKVVQGLEKGSGEFAHGFTFNGSAVGCAASLAVLNYIESKDLINRSQEMGDYLKNQLEKRLTGFTIVGDIRGKGLFVGVEFVADKATKNTFDGKLKVSEKISDKMKDKGVLIRPINGYIDGSVGDCVFVSPPFIVTKEQIDEMCSKLAEAIAETEKEVLGFRT
jgi:adenosylmethionine-8-amino-7-oxononanoate aminotransferase